MKFNSATLAKNQFWLLTGIFVVLVMLAPIWLWTVVAGGFEEMQKKIDDAKLKQRQHQPGKNEKDLEVLRAREEELVGLQKTVWAKVWDTQKDLLVWNPALSRLNECYFGDDEAQSNQKIDSDFLNQYRSKIYEEQLTELGRMVKWVPPFNQHTWERGIQVAEWRALGLDRAVPVSKWDHPAGAVTSEDLWLALEDLLLYREMLRAAKETTENVAQLKPVGTSQPDRNKGELFRQRFRNPYWELDLVIAQDADRQPVFRGKMTNVYKQRQVFGRMEFQVWLRKDDPRPVNLKVEGEPLGVGMSVAIADARIDVPNPREVVRVDQVLTPRALPIKRIDQIAIGAHSHRTFDAKKPLQPHRTMGGGAGNKDVLSANGFQRMRYMQVTDQVRRIPIGMAVVCDQANVQDFVTAFANSKLRIQTTQVHWQHMRGGIRTSTPSPVIPVAIPGRPGIGQPAAAEEMETSLVEVAVYGVASLYERFPPRPPTVPVPGAVPVPPAIPGAVPPTSP